MTGCSRIFRGGAFLGLVGGDWKGEFCPDCRGDVDLEDVVEWSGEISGVTVGVSSGVLSTKEEEVPLLAINWLLVIRCMIVDN